MLVYWSVVDHLQLGFFFEANNFKSIGICNRHVVAGERW